MSGRQATALILAGKRDGRIDPLAAAAGVTHKCLVPIAGDPLIGHVLSALAASPEIGEIRISIDDPDALSGLALVRSLVELRRLRIVPSRPNLVDSVHAAAEDAAYPLLVTTADNVLLSPQTVDQFVAAATGAEVAVAFATREAVLAAHPEGQRRFYRFSDNAYSNCNTYWLGSPAALGAAETFRGGGQFAKHPMRIVRAFGLINLIRFRYGIGTLDQAFARFSRRFAMSMRAVIVSDGATAIDVDNDRTHAIASALLLERQQQRATDVAIHSQILLCD